MAEVIADAPSLGFTEEDVTQHEDVPTEVRHRANALHNIATTKPEEDPDELVVALKGTVDDRDVVELGAGDQSVYGYDYACAPDRLKIGSCTGDVLARVAAQISTGTPDRPRLLLVIRTHDCRALERALHGIFRIKGKQVAGAGAEWFRVSREDVIDCYQRILQ